MNLPVLCKLQELENRLSDVLDRLNGLQEGREIRKLKEEFQRLKHRLEQGEAELKENQRQQEAENNEIKLIQLNKQASEAIKFSRDTDTVKKLENIEKQIERLDQQKLGLENRLIKLIEDAETIERDAVETKKKLSFIKKKYGSIKENSETELSGLGKEKIELQRQIDSVLPLVDAGSLELYRKIKKTHRDAVVVLEGRKCSGCKVELPAMDYEAVKAEKAGIRCENCGRLLYYERG